MPVMRLIGRVSNQAISDARARMITPAVGSSWIPATVVGLSMTMDR